MKKRIGLCMHGYWNSSVSIAGKTMHGFNCLTIQTANHPTALCKLCSKALEMNDVEWETVPDETDFNIPIVNSIRNRV